MESIKRSYRRHIHLGSQHICVEPKKSTSCNPTWVKSCWGSTWVKSCGAWVNSC